MCGPPPTAIDSPGTQLLLVWFSWYLLRCCFDVGGNKVFIFIHRVCLLKGIKLVSYSFCILIAYICK